VTSVEVEGARDRVGAHPSPDRAAKVGETRRAPGPSLLRPSIWAGGRWTLHPPSARAGDVGGVDTIGGPSFRHPRPFFPGGK
jgi:hypothetical protein